MSTVLNVNDLDEQLRSAIEGGEEITIERDGIVCARIVPVATTAPRKFGQLKGMGHISDEALFDPIMTNEELDEWENDDFTGPRYQPGTPGNV